MSVIDVKEDGNSYRHNATLNEQGIPIVEFTAVWTVTFDENDPPINRPILARTANGIPTYYDTHPIDDWLYVYDITPNQLGPLYYEVVVRYRSFENPISFLFNPPLIDWDEEATQEPIDRDASGVVITNTAGQPLDPPLEREFNDSILRITVNRTWYNTLRAVKYQQPSVNSDTFWGFPPGQVKCRRIHGEPFRVANSWFFKHEYEFLVRDDLSVGPEGPAYWKRRVKNEGLMAWDAPGIVDRKLIPCVDSEGKQVTEPVPLDIWGVQMDMSDASTVPIWSLHQLYPSLPFALLGLQDVFTYWTGLSP